MKHGLYPYPSLIGRRGLRSGRSRWFVALLFGCSALMLNFSCHAGETTRVSVDSAGNQVNGSSGGFALSADGRYVAFSSYASNLIAGDTNAADDIFVHDRQTGDTTRVSVDSAGNQANGESYGFALSADGRYVAFSSYASNLVAGDTNGILDVFVHDRQTGVTTRVSVDSVGNQTNNYSHGVGSNGGSLSADGRYVGFTSDAIDLVVGDTNNTYDVFVHDRQTGVTTRVSVDSVGNQTSLGMSNDPALSADGRYVAFSSNALNLVAGDTNNYFDIFVHDRQTGETTRVSVDSAGNQTANYGESYGAALSADGRYVAFESYASNLAAGDTNDAYDIFVHDRQSGETTRVSVPSNDNYRNSGGSILSADGRYVAFTSDAIDLVAGDTNGTWDVFVHDRGVPPPEQTLPIRQDITVDPGLYSDPARKAVVITHGWNANATAWVEEMGQDYCFELGAPADTAFPPVRAGYMARMCQVNDWDVWIADWRAGADNRLTSLINPWEAYVNAIGLGQALATNLKGSNYQHIHLIAHSAGSNLIDTATTWLKTWATIENRQAPTIHETFLDAYDPRHKGSPYGQYADWTDNYVDRRALIIDKGLDATKLFLDHAYTIDVTPNTLLDGCDNLVDLSFVCRHSRPYRFYGLSVYPKFVGNDDYKAHDPIGSTGGMGYPLSVENGHTLTALKKAYPQGKSCVFEGDICYPGTALPPGFWHFLPTTLTDTTIDYVKGTVDYVLGVGAKLFNTLKLGTNSPLVSSSLRFMPLASATITEVVTMTTATDAPSSLAVSVDDISDAPSMAAVFVNSTEPVNTLRFGWRFAEAGEGYLRVFVDDKMVFELDQRHVPLVSTALEEVYVGGETGTLPVGKHRIAFRLDGFGSSASGVELADVELGVRVAATATANAGVSRTVRLGSLVTLDGTASTDTDNGPSPLSFLWTQLGTPVVTLNGATTSKPSFTPSVKEIYTFNLVVNDGQASSAPASVTITVPPLGDIDMDGDVDSTDLNLVLAARNKPASGPNDLRDLDGNMKLDALDARKLTTLCTRPRCATQ